MKFDYTRTQEKRHAEQPARISLVIFLVPFLAGAGLGYVTWGMAIEKLSIDYSVSWSRVIWSALQYGIPVCLTMFSGAGLFVIPMTALTRGYIFSIVSYVTYQSADITIVLFHRIIPGLLQMTGLYLLMQFALQTALDGVRRKTYVRTIMHRNNFLRVFVCYLLLTLLSAAMAVFFSEI